MIRSHTIAIEEIDDVEEAVKEVRGQLSTLSLLRNSVGVVTTHPEFVTSGVYGAISKALPFANVGVTTICQSTNQQSETYLLSILVLTSDDCEFSCGFSDPIPKEGGVAELTKRCYLDCREGLSLETKLNLLYVPMIPTHHSYQYLSALNEVDERIPSFGMVANDDKHGIIYDNDSRTLMNGREYEDRLVMLLVAGNVEPKTYIGSLAEDSIIMSDIGAITSSEDNKLLGINDMNAIDFLKKAGSKLVDGEVGILSTTFLLDLSIDGILICRTPLSTDDEGILCGGNMPIGATLSMASSTHDVVMETAGNVMDEIKRNHTEGTILLFSCVGRRNALYGNPMKEFEFFRESLSNDYNFVAACASGEICPTSVTPEKANNQEHNQTLIVCVF